MRRGGRHGRRHGGIGGDEGEGGGGEGEGGIGGDEGEGGKGEGEGGGREGEGLPARNIDSHCGGQATLSGSDRYRCDEARPVTSRSNEMGTTAARCPTHWCSQDAGGCERPVPLVMAPVSKTAAVPRRMKFTARIVAC